MRAKSPIEFRRGHKPSTALDIGRTPRVIAKEFETECKKFIISCDAHPGWEYKDMWEFNVFDNKDEIDDLQISWVPPNSSAEEEYGKGWGMADDDGVPLVENRTETYEPIIQKILEIKYPDGVDELIEEHERSLNHLKEVKARIEGESLQEAFQNFERGKTPGKSLELGEHHKSVSVITYGGKESKYDKSEIKEFLDDPSLSMGSDNLPRWLLTSGLANSKSKIKKILEKVYKHKGSVVINVQSDRPYANSVLYESPQEAFQNFERGKTTGESLGLGKYQYKDYEDYVEKVCAKLGLNPDHFWNRRASWIRDSDAWEIDEDRLEILQNTPVEYRVAWWGEDMAGWIEEQEEQDE